MTVNTTYATFHIIITSIKQKLLKGNEYDTINRSATKKALGSSKNPTDISLDEELQELEKQREFDGNLYTFN